MNKPFITVFIEACVVGICLIPFTYLAGLLAQQLVSKPSLPEVCQSWNENYIMEINLFLAGFLFHLVFEYMYINKWYVDNYYQNLPLA